MATSVPAACRSVVQGRLWYTKTAGAACALCSESISPQRRRLLHSSPRLTAQEAQNPPVPSISKDKAYAKTLMLPKTDFPLRADAANREKLFRKRTTEDLYKWQWNQKDRPIFVLHDGPPYANGNLHIGHAMNKILKDVINRYKVLRGHRVHYVPGWDCHGLPIEHKALKQLEVDHREMDHLEVRKIARKTADKAIKVQLKEFKEFGLMADWSNVYRTFDRPYEVRQLRVFQQMMKKGLIYRQDKPVLWSPSSRTALAEAEINYKDDHVSQTVYVRFPLQMPGKALDTLLYSYSYQSPIPEVAKIDLVIWTTTPWTLPGNMFVSYGAAITYCVARFGESHLLVAKDRVEFLSKLLEQDAQILISFNGTALNGSTYTPPFPLAWTPPGGLPLHEAEYVTADSGTGLVHSAPAHGMDDYASWKQRSSADSPAQAQAHIACYVDEDGKYSARLAEDSTSKGLRQLVGKSVLNEGLQAVIALLEAQGSLLAKAKIRHKYPYDWKTKQPVIVRSTPQWFANIDDIKENAVDALQNVRFVPEQGRNRLESFTRSRSEWCISRQRSWGVPIPVLYEAESGEPVVDDASTSYIIETLAEKGIDHWWKGPVDDFLTPAMRQSGKVYEKCMDTMDVWFDSGVSWTGIAEQLEQEGHGERPTVADIYLEGSDQHRGWFQSSLLTSIATTGKAPYATVITHGFVLDKDGVKMSKSDGNVISPLAIINGEAGSHKIPAYGADVLRFWAASAGYTREVVCSMDTIAGSAETLRKIRNTLRFILGNLANDTSPPLSEVKPADLSFVDRYVLHELDMLQRTVQDSYDQYLFNRGINAVSHFCANTLSSFYFEIVKDSLYADALASKSRTGVAYTLQQVLRVIATSIAPITPHLAEDVWQHWPSSMQKSGTSFFEGEWSSTNTPWEDASLAQIMQPMLTLRKEAMSAIESARRNSGQIGNSVEAAIEIVVTNSISNELKSFLQDNEPFLSSFFVVSDVKLVEASSQTKSALSSRPALLGEHGSVTIACLRAEAGKCPRCWQHTRVAVQDLCSRCEQVLAS